MDIGVHKLAPNEIGAVVSRNTIGTYLLGALKHGKFKAHYVGRSDTCLNRRLLQHAKRKAFSHFAVQPTDTVFEAFCLECREWHIRKDCGDLVNLLHPDAPRHLPYWCPYCLTTKEFSRLTNGKEVFA